MRSVTRRMFLLSGCVVRQCFFPRSKPVGRVEPASDAGLERGIRPVGDVGDIAVLDGIEVHVIYMRGEVRVVADAVFPESPLPDPALPVPPSGG